MFYYSFVEPCSRGHKEVWWKPRPTVSSCFHHKLDLDPNFSIWSVAVNRSHYLIAIPFHNSFRNKCGFIPIRFCMEDTVFSKKQAPHVNIYIYIIHIYLFIYLFIHLFLFIYLFIYLIIYLIIYLHIVNFPIFVGFPSTCPWDPLVTNFHNLTKTIEHLDIFGAVFFFEVVFFLSISYIGFWKEAAVMTPFSNGHVKLVDWLPQSSLAVLKLY